MSQPRWAFGLSFLDCTCGLQTISGKWRFFRELMDVDECSDMNSWCTLRFWMDGWWVARWLNLQISKRKWSWEPKSFYIVQLGWSSSAKNSNQNLQGGGQETHLNTRIQKTCEHQILTKPKLLELSYCMLKFVWGAARKKQTNKNHHSSQSCIYCSSNVAFFNDSNSKINRCEPLIRFRWWKWCWKYTGKTPRACGQSN